MAYVALSRATSLDGLIVDGMPNQLQQLQACFNTSQEVERFYRTFAPPPTGAGMAAASPKPDWSLHAQPQQQQGPQAAAAAAFGGPLWDASIVKQEQQPPVRPQTEHAAQWAGAGDSTAAFGGAQPRPVPHRTQWLAEQQQAANASVAFAQQRELEREHLQRQRDEEDEQRRQQKQRRLERQREQRQQWEARNQQQQHEREDKALQVQFQRSIDQKEYKHQVNEHDVARDPGHADGAVTGTWSFQDDAGKWQKFDARVAELCEHACRSTSSPSLLLRKALIVAVCLHAVWSVCRSAQPPTGDNWGDDHWVDVDLGAGRSIDLRDMAMSKGSVKNIPVQRNGISESLGCVELNEARLEEEGRSWRAATFTAVK